MWLFCGGGWPRLLFELQVASVPALPPGACQPRLRRGSCERLIGIFIQRADVAIRGDYLGLTRPPDVGGCARRRCGCAWGPLGSAHLPSPRRCGLPACISSSPPACSLALETEGTPRVEGARTPPSSLRLMNNLAAQGPRQAADGEAGCMCQGRKRGFRSPPPPPQAPAHSCIPSSPFSTSWKKTRRGCAR